MDELIRRMRWTGASAEEARPLVEREWLVTNGLGGYASSTVAGVCTRRYHGLLVAALPAPQGRTVMLNHLMEQVRLPDGRTLRLGGEQHADGKLELQGVEYLREFRLEGGLPVWRWEMDRWVLEKRVLLVHEQNTVHVGYRLVSGEGTVRLKLRLAIHFRPHDEKVSTSLEGPYALTAVGDRYEVSPGTDLTPLRFRMHGRRAAFTVEAQRTQPLLYWVEEARGYDSRGELWSPGHFRIDLTADHDATLVASTEKWETMDALSPAVARAAEHERRRRLLALTAPAARSGPGGEWTLAADQFLIAPAGRIEEAARAKAAGDEARTVIAGYHWFTDWGRDTMISLEGLTLTTGRPHDARSILHTFATHVRHGLIPNLFPEGSKEGLYHTADATLWFVQAIGRYYEVTKDRETIEFMLPIVRDIVAHHLSGTRFGIGVDPSDGLLRQGAEGYQLTWMDAKCGDWVVTPRRGKAVEINALWYNALRRLEHWEREFGDEAKAQTVAKHAELARRSFNQRFWYAEGGFLYDVVDGEKGDDPSCRPNQLFAISLSNPVLDKERWPAVMDVVRARLLTPVGLRSLAPGEPDYKPTYHGDLRSRDAAYHQGTVWPWLIGPFIDAWLKMHPDDRTGARRFLQGLADHLEEACLGSISEVADAEAPFTPRGCIAQAWSVAETLRSWVNTAE
ncbi:MAG TPA: amylo-alpha-1,6-glucosidase [Gemmataceae bacterium]|nr:amylo-alpha-1,6-glucosidase [Gemmataceae bacterium]